MKVIKFTDAQIEQAYQNYKIENYSKHNLRKIEESKMNPMARTAKKMAIATMAEGILALRSLKLALQSKESSIGGLYRKCAAAAMILNF